jgi:mono/diheme cytochrome c family protein
MLKSGIAKKLLLALGLPVLAGAQTFKYWDVTDTAKVPKTLSATGLYTNITAVKKTMLANAYKFEVNSPLWSDDSHKTRWVMNKPGTSITYDEKNDYWGYPDSAVFIKLFALDTVPGDTTTRLLFETRFLINKKEIVDSTTGKKMDSWYGYSYKWRRNQQEADLVAATGADDSVKYFPTGKNNPGKMKKWRFPSRSQCEQCHRVGYADSVHGRSVLGFFTAQLNRPRADLANINQLEYFFQQNVLKGTKSVWAAATTPRWYGVDDSLVNGVKISVDTRARAYIAANCSGCHGTRGMANSATFGVDLNYDYHDMVDKGRLEFRHKSTSWPFGLDDDSIQPKYYPKTDAGNNPKAYDSLMIDPALVVPGYPQKSVILYRQLVRKTTPGDYDPERNQMPPVATFEVNVAATNLIRRWILEMPKIPAPTALGIRGQNMRTNLKGPAIQGHQIVLPMEMAGPGTVKVTLTGIQGRTIELTQVTRTAYALPSNLTPGVYIIKVGKQNFTRYLF